MLTYNLIKNKILTSVRKITFLNQPPQFFSSAANNILQDFVPIIRITDADGFFLFILIKSNFFKDNPVMGKTPEITLVK